MEIHGDRPAGMRPLWACGATHRAGLGRGVGLPCGLGEFSGRGHARDGRPLRLVRWLVRSAGGGKARSQGQGCAHEKGQGRAEEGCRLWPNADGSAADRRVDRYPESDALQQRRARGAGAGLHRRARPSDADGRLQHHREGPLPPLQPLQQCADAIHAAHHLVGSGAARRRAAGLSRFARLHSHVARLRPEAVAHHRPGRASHRRSPRARPGRIRASQAVRAEAETARARNRDGWADGWTRCRAGNRAGAGDNRGRGKRCDRRGAAR